MSDQVERYNQLLSLVKTTEDVCSFVDAVRSLPNKLQLLENTIDRMLKQMVECAILIRQYTGHGFGGEQHKHINKALTDNLVGSTYEADAFQQCPKDHIFQSSFALS